jgi:hypothetical protein
MNRTLRILAFIVGIWWVLNIFVWIELQYPSHHIFYIPVSQ